jgi:zinc protease
MIKLKSLTVYILTTIVCLATFSILADVQIKDFKTKKNIQVILVEDRSSDVVSVHFSLKGTGTRVDPVGKEGLANLLTQLLMERTKEGSDRFILDKKLKSLGVLQGIHHVVDSDNIHFSFKAPREKLKEVFAILKIFVSDPNFDPKELDKMKNFDPSGSRLATANEGEFAVKILLNKLLSGHPYANPASGTLDGRQSVTVDDIKEAFQHRFARDVLVFSVVGDIKPDTLSSYIDSTFGGLSEKATLPQIPGANINADGKLSVIPKNSPQSGVVFGHAGVTVSDPDYLPLQILNDTLGGKPFTSRLWANAREARGLVYGINTQIVRWDKASLLTGGFETENSKVKEVIELVRQEWQKIHEKGITEEEFKASKTGLLGNFALNFTNSDGIASYLLTCHLSGLPLDYINKRNRLLTAITLEDVNRVAKTRLDPKKLTFVVVGQPSQ